MERQIEAYLFDNIPITQAMGIRVEYASLQKIILSAPLSNNINHKKTVFGGSLHAVATLACWCLIYLNLKEASLDHFQIVVTKSEADYLAPVNSDFKAECLMPDKENWQRFIKILQLKGKARLSLSAAIYQHGQLAVDYQAVFAALALKAV